VTITSEQVKTARQLLSWTPLKQAMRIGVSEKAILASEAGGACSPPLHLDLVRERLESAGVIFVEENGEGPGVRLKKSER